MNSDDQNLINILQKQSYVSEEDVKKAELKAKQSGTSLTSALLDLGLITKPLLGQAVAESMGVPFANLESNPPSQNQVMRIPADLGKKYRVVLQSEDDQSVTIASDHPQQDMAQLHRGRKLLPKKCQ